MIADLNPNHEIFQKGYLPGKRREFNPKPEVMIRNPNGFYDGLPSREQLGSKQGKASSAYLGRLNPRSNEEKAARLTDNI